MQKLRELCQDLAAGKCSSVGVIKQAFSSIEALEKQGNVAFLKLYKNEALAQAEQWDNKRKNGEHCPILAGVPVSIKDCYDIVGSITRAGSRVLEHSPMAIKDASIVAKLRQLGAIIVGRTNMTEFAYSGLGNNTHFGTPLSDIANERLAGGSSSGAAVSVAESMAIIAIGSDTSGSVRIPAAFCGIAGFRPSQGRYPDNGIIPLAPSFDVVGSIAPTVDCLAFLDTLLCSHAKNTDTTDLSKERFLVPVETMDDLDTTVNSNFLMFLSKLENRGIDIEKRPLPELLALRQCVADAGIVAAEAFCWHEELFYKARDLYDPRVAMRLEDAGLISAVPYLKGISAINKLRCEIDVTMENYSGMLMPTTPIIAPMLSEIIPDDQYLKLNATAIRNTAIANHLDLPAITFPIHNPGQVNVGAMLIGLRLKDCKTLSLGTALENIIHGDKK